MTGSHKPRALTHSERSLIAMALRDKAVTDRAAAAVIADLQPRLAETFERQADTSDELAELLDGADMVDVWP